MALVLQDTLSLFGVHPAEKQRLLFFMAHDIVHSSIAKFAFTIKDENRLVCSFQAQRFIKGIEVEYPGPLMITKYEPWLRSERFIWLSASWIAPL